MTGLNTAGAKKAQKKTAARVLIGLRLSCWHGVTAHASSTIIQVYKLIITGSATMINYGKVEKAVVLAKREAMWNELQTHYNGHRPARTLYKNAWHGSLKWCLNKSNNAPKDKFWQAWVNYLQSEEIEAVEKSDILKEAENILYNQLPDLEPKQSVKRPRKLKSFKSMGQVQQEANAAGTGDLFRRMPDWILRAPRPAEYKIIYAILLSYQGIKDEAWPGYDLLCEQAHVSRATLSKFLKELTRDGLITVKRRGLGMSNRYEVFDQFKGKSKSGSKE
jgi:hypothetical protein